MDENHKKEIEKLTLGMVLFDAPLKERTTLHIGGPAEVLAIPCNSKSLSDLVAYATSEGLPYFILGKGSNILVRDGGIRGLVINLSAACQQVSLLWQEGDNGMIEAEAGAPLAKLVQLAAEKSFGGLEFLTGIPGSVGGALSMNAGTREGEMKDALDCMTLMDKTGQVTTVPLAGLNISYRGVRLPPGTVILAGRFRVKKNDQDRIRQRMARAIEYRRMRHPMDMPNAGCVFKNPPEGPAGKIIEELGLKGMKVGGAQVSPVHANFIVNTGNATAGDFLELVDLVKEKVAKEKGVQLSLELMVVGEEATF